MKTQDLLLRLNDVRSQSDAVTAANLLGILIADLTDETLKPVHHDDVKASIKGAILSDTRDWSAQSRDAWVYGIIIGWDQTGMTECVKQHGWKHGQTDKLRRLHLAFERMEYKR